MSLAQEGQIEKQSSGESQTKLKCLTSHMSKGHDVQI